MDLVFIIRAVFKVMDMLILARIILSFTGLNSYHPAVRFIYETTEPILAPIRKIMPNTGMIDFSPMLAWLLLGLVESLLLRLV